jgi:hypothetical protein
VSRERVALQACSLYCSSSCRWEGLRSGSFRTRRRWACFVRGTCSGCEDSCNTAGDPTVESELPVAPAG